MRRRELRNVNVAQAKAKARTAAVSSGLNAWSHPSGSGLKAA
ncbi:hypothetical protein HMPREF0972_01665 [Actinomyces sp. oral taxon 848 str. F0332]|nr:hypothetical protein HMPREF0972_01665 [Actinomyces sp. oral taxon 848 str. F0332]